MIESAKMARSYTSVRLHTHLAENKSDVDYSLAKFGKIPGDYAESVGWLGDDVWHAHCVKLSDDSIAKFGRTGTGVAHCPCSNTRLGSGIAPIRKMLNHGVPVGLGVDGSASNDTLTDGANSSNPNATDAGTALDETLGALFTSAGSSKKQVRVNCRVEAKNRGLRGRAKREFRRDCKRNGGFDDGAEDFLGASGSSGFGCTTANGMVGSWVNVPQGTFPETYKRTCVSRGFRDRA
jgi:hypothetical protein